jgi:hypothetical protein
MRCDISGDDRETGNWRRGKNKRLELLFYRKTP